MMPVVAGNWRTKNDKNENKALGIARYGSTCFFFLFYFFDLRETSKLASAVFWVQKGFPLNNRGA
jgi:hypothetical protein